MCSAIKNDCAVCQFDTLCNRSQKWPWERERAVLVTLHQHSILPTQATVTHTLIQTACTQCCCCLTPTEKNGMKTLKRVKAYAEFHSVWAIQRRALIRMCSEGTAVHLKPALCSWDRHGDHSNKNINNSNKKSDRQQALSDFPLCLWSSGSHSRAEEGRASAQHELNVPLGKYGVGTKSSKKECVMLHCYKQPGPKARQRPLLHRGGSCAIQTPVKAQGMTRKSNVRLQGKRMHTDL